MGERTKFVIGFFVVMAVLGTILEKSGCDKENNLPSGNSSVNSGTHTCQWCNKKFTGSGYSYMPICLGGSSACVVDDNNPKECSKKCCEEAH